MKSIIMLLSLLTCWSSNSVSAQNQDNVLTESEKAAGWKLLFNGKNLEGWTTVEQKVPPEEDWKAERGMLFIRPENEKHRDIISIEKYGDFDLQVDFKLTEGANSGIKYFFSPYDEGGWLGMEYQIIDNKRHPDAKLGQNGNRQQSTLYDILPTAKKIEIQIDEWNHARIVAKGTLVTHYLNGQEVLRFDRKSTTFNQARLLSKFKDVSPPFGSVNSGHILLQDHGDVVYFKNIKIKKR